MTTSVAVLGAGGKMGFRVTGKLIGAGYDVRAVDVGEAGRKRLAEAITDASCSQNLLDSPLTCMWSIPTSRQNF